MVLGSAGSGPDTGLAPAYAAARLRLGLVAALFAVAAIGWVWTAREMRGMDAGPWTSLGSLGWFLGVWIVMMAAMMFPSVAPTAALYARTTKQRWPLRPWLFAAGYLLTWAAAGLIAYAIGAAMTTTLGDTLAWDRAGRGLAGATLIIAAVYEVTPLKDVCLGKCRSPLGVLLGSWREGSLGAVRMGTKNGACPAGEDHGEIVALLLGERAGSRQRDVGVLELAGSGHGPAPAVRAGGDRRVLPSAAPGRWWRWEPGQRVTPNPNTHGPEESVVHTAALQRLGYGGRTPTRGEVKGRPSRPCPVAAGAGKLVGVALPCAEPTQKPPERPYRSGGAAQRRRSSGQDRRPTFEGVSSAFAPVEPPVQFGGLSWVARVSSVASKR